MIESNPEFWRDLIFDFALYMFAAYGFIKFVHDVIKKVLK